MPIISKLNYYGKPTSLVRGHVHEDEKIIPYKSYPNWFHTLQAGRRAASTGEDSVRP